MRAMWLGELIGERCLACGAGGARLCDSCHASLRRCSQGPLPDGVATMTAAWSYEGPARALILALKLRGLRSAAAPLVDGMVEAARRGGLVGTVVTWVPGGGPGIRARGFDHAELLARGLARELGLRALPFLQRRRASPDQASLSARERALNARTAFRARSSPSQVVLVDDLLTTGATAAACAGALKAAGSDRIELVVAGRA